MYCIFSFKSRFEAMKLYENAKKNGIACNVISTPAFVSIGCGLSVKCDQYRYNALYSVFLRLKFLSFQGAFSVSSVGGKNVTKRLLY